MASGRKLLGRFKDSDRASSGAVLDSAYGQRSVRGMWRNIKGVTNGVRNNAGEAPNSGDDNSGHGLCVRAEQRCSPLR